MRTRKKDKSNLTKVGIFVTILTAIMMIMVVSISKERSIFDSKVTVRARVPSVSALKAGSYVELKGIRIGNVKNIQIISEEEVEISMNILERELKWLKKDSRISISTAGLVGDKFVEIFTGSKDAEKFDPEKDFLVSEESANFKQLITKGESIATVTERILQKLDNILNHIGNGEDLVKSMKSISKASSNLEVITSELKDAHVGSTLKGVNQTMANFNKSTSSLERIVTRIEKGPGTMNSLIYDDSVHDDLRALLGGAQRNKVIKYFIRESIKKSEQKERQPQQD